MNPFRWLAQACGNLARALSAPPAAPLELYAMHRELVKLMRAVAIQEAQCDAAQDRLRALKDGDPGAIREAETVSGRFLDDYREGLQMLDAAMERFQRMREAARSSGYGLGGLDLPVWDDRLRREARSHVADGLELDPAVLAAEPHEEFDARLRRGSH